MKIRCITLLRSGTMVVVLALSTSCATLISGTTQEVPIASDPTGADVIADGAKVGKTPMTLKLKRKDDHLVTLEKSQYQPKSVAIVRSANIVRTGAEDFFFPLSFPVDAYYGSEYDLIPATIALHLEPAAVAPPPSDEQAAFVAQLKALDAKKAAKAISDADYSHERLALFRQYMPEALPEDVRQTPAAPDPAPN